MTTLPFPAGTDLPIEHEPLTEEAGCETLCKMAAPEQWAALFKFFAELPERITFSAQDNRPTPMFSRTGDVVEFSVGVEAGKDKITGLPLYTRKRFVIELDKL